MTVIRITEAVTKAGRAKKVVIDDVTAEVGKAVEVTDKFVERLEKEFPHFKFDKDVEPEETPADADAEIIARDQTTTESKPK